MFFSPCYACQRLEFYRVQQETSIAAMTFEFSLDMIKLCSELVRAKEFVLAKQLLRSATSIGANVEEGSAAQTKKDFITKMAIASKEAREAKYWLRLLKASHIAANQYDPYLDKIDRIVKVLTKIVKTAQQNLRSGA